MYPISSALHTMQVGICYYTMSTKLVLPKQKKCAFAQSDTECLNSRILAFALKMLKTIIFSQSPNAVPSLTLRLEIKSKICPGSQKKEIRSFLRQQNRQPSVDNYYCLFKIS